MLDRAAKAGGKKQTASTGWQKITASNTRPPHIPMETTNIPLIINTVAITGLSPIRSAIHPIKSGMVT